jgi:hypothetical protein
MTPPFPPQFFILLGIDVFLGGSILVVLFDKEFPNGLPYILDFGALIGFVQLLIVPGYLSDFPTQIQFYYSIAFATMAVLSLVGCSLYVIVRHKTFVGGILTVSGALPSTLALLYFGSAWVNNTQVPISVIPLMPWPVIWGAFLGASALVLVAMAVMVRGDRLKGHSSPD